MTHYPLDKLQKRVGHDLHQKIGDELAGPGAEVVCEQCGAVHEATGDQVASYMRNGWPECCGQTMTFRRKKTDG